MKPNAEKIAKGMRNTNGHPCRSGRAHNRRRNAEFTGSAGRVKPESAVSIDDIIMPMGKDICCEIATDILL